MGRMWRVCEQGQMSASAQVPTEEVLSHTRLLEVQLVQQLKVTLGKPELPHADT